MAEIGNRPRSRRLARLGGLLISATLAAPAAAATDAYQDWLRGQLQGAGEMDRQYQVYRGEQDQQFSSHLKAQWQEFQVFQGKVRDPKPKPKVVPVAPPEAKVPPRIPPKAPEVPATPPPPSVLPRIEPPPPRIEPPPPPAKPSETARDRGDFGFYGNSVSLPHDPQWRNARSRGIDPAGFAAFWDTMSVTRIQPTLDAVEKNRRELRLDDWGHVALWRELARSLQPDHPAEQSLLLWYFLVKAGVDVRLGYSGEQIYLFVSVRQPVYSASFIKFGERTYYALLNADRGKSLRSFKTYEANYPNPLAPLDLKGAATGFTRAEPIKKRVSFQYQGRAIDLKFDYDGQLVQYLAGFPQLDFALYFATDGSPAARNPLLQELRGRIQGMSEEAAVNFLLAFVQKAFAYKTDEEQFGYEKYFFVEETLYYPYSDCEDRAALFSWLVRELTGLKTVGLHYPGHMTTGVAIKAPKPNWAAIDWKGERYVIADPTYINAGIGMAMPSYAKLQPLHVIPTP